jgi:hypothetical protein
MIQRFTLSEAHHQKSHSFTLSLISLIRHSFLKMLSGSGSGSESGNAPKHQALS